MDKGELKPLSGFRDELPETMIPKQAMLRTIEGVFESFGFAPLDTPALEKTSVLLGKYGEEGEQLLYRFRDRGDRDVALRYELTVPLARVVAANADLPIPFKRYQIGKVWRADRPGRGRYREFEQCDVDIVGSKSMLADLECLQVICGVLDALGVPGYRVRVSNRRMLDSVLAGFGVTETERVHSALRSLDKIDKIGAGEVQKLLVETAGLSDGDAEKFLGTVKGGIEVIRPLLPEEDRGLAEITELLQLAADSGIGDRVELDATIARGLAYYTGTIFETFLDTLPDIGSVMSGGRYDDLLQAFAGRDLPSVGVSLGISRLTAALEELGLAKAMRSPARVLVAYFGPDTARETLECAAVLRKAGINTLTYPGKAKLGKQFKYADRLGVTEVCVVGPDEAAAGKVRVKVLETGEQREVTLAELPEAIAGE